MRGLEEGTDSEGVARKLGDRDSAGYIVGFIDYDGNCWETVAERDRSLTAGRYHDAMCMWERSGSEGEAPDVRSVAMATCYDAENLDDAIQDALDQREFLVKVRRAGRRQMVEEIAAEIAALDDASPDDIKALIDDYILRQMRD